MTALVEAEGETEIRGVTIAGGSEDAGLLITGNEARADVWMGTGATYDIQVDGRACHVAATIRAPGGTAGLRLVGDANTARVTTTGGTVAALIAGDSNRVDVTADGTDTALEITGDHNTAHVQAVATDETAVEVSGHFNRVTGSSDQAGNHGAHVTGDGNTVDMTITESGQATDNTYDNVLVEGNRNTITGTLEPSGTAQDTRNGANVAAGATNNKLWNLDVGEAAAYGTDDVTDDGTTTSQVNVFAQ